MFGLETITIRRDATTSWFVAAGYQCFVNTASRAPELDVSNARVVKQGSGQLATFGVSSSPDDPSRDVWYVVNLLIAAAGNVTVAPVQRFQPGDSNTVV